MPSSQNVFLEGEPDPQALVGQFVHWLLIATIHCAAGVAFGMLAARLMRSRHLHWSWAALALLLVVLARPGSKAQRPSWRWGHSLPQRAVDAGIVKTSVPVPISPRSQPPEDHHSTSCARSLGRSLERRRCD